MLLAFAWIAMGNKMHGLYKQITWLHVNHFIYSSYLKSLILFVRNYVVQYVLELEDCEVADALSRYLDGNYVQLSCDKYGSHAVQKFLKNRQFNSRRIVKELLCDIDSLLVNPYGNYVIQTAWSVSQVRN